VAELARPESAVARFRDRRGAVVGAGFLVAEGLVVTCAHVLAAATGQDERLPPGGPVTVEFPVRGPLGPARCTATVVGWTPTRPDDRGDIAVLRLDGDVPDGVRAARLSPAPAPAGGEIDALGFPDALAEQGLWARGRIRKEQATGWLQIDSVPGGPRISPGFSGTPVFSAEAGGVIGMVVAVVRDAEHTTTFLNPARTLVAEHPELHDAQASPYRGLAPFAEGDAAWFRGRDELIEDALGKAAVHPLLVLSGPSGSGKSSLARAGLLPRLRAQGRTVVPVRVPAGEPAATLLARILHQLTAPAAGNERALAESIEAGADPGRYADELTGPGGHVVLLDQFEEAEPDTARRLTGYLYRLAAAAGPRPDGAPRLLVVLTLRGGQLDAVATGETAAAMQAGLVLVAPMTAAQLRTAVTAPGAVFETGLVDRLVTDAGTEPGTLPLLEFTLDRLWDRRELGVLTHAGYDELGGVAGAVARYADRAYERDPVRARRLLVLLAGPDDDGVFRRRPLRLADLPAGLRPALDRLVAARLVVAGPDAAGEPVAELAHEALIRAWPRLRDWLDQDREFRTWLEDVRRGARRWQAADREPEALLRGAALAAAERWTEARGPDLTPGETAYVRASLVQDRRRARRGRGLTAALVVLTLLAGLFALGARQQSGEFGEQLRKAASRQLADDAEFFRRSDPGKSLQLALAAWHAARTPEAYGALFTQYAALEPVDRILTGLTEDQGEAIEAISTSGDGAVAVVADAGGGGAVWRGLGGGDPQRVAPGPGPARYVGGHYRVSPSGRRVAYANALGGVYVRDLTRPAQPAVDLAPSGPDVPGGPTTVQMIQFASDDSGLAVLRTDAAGAEAELRVWDLRTRKAVPGLPMLDDGFVPTSVYFGPVPGSIVLSTLDVVASYDLASRRNLRVFRKLDEGRPIVAGGGSLVVSCGRDDTVVVRDVGTGRRLRSVAVPACAGFDVDNNGEFAVLPGEATEPRATNTSLVVVDPRAGTAHRPAVPPADVRSGFEPYAMLAGYRGVDGPAVLLADGVQLYRIGLGPAVTLHSTGGLGLNLRQESAVTPDGRHRVLVDTDSGRLTLVETGTDRQIATTAARPPVKSTGFQGLRRGFTADGRRLLTAQQGELTVRRLPDLAVEHRLDLPVPAGLGGPPGTEPFTDDWAGSVVPLGDEQAIVLYAGMLTRWNVVTGARLGEPVPLRADQDAGKQRRAALLAFASGRRPGHPDQVAVVLPDSTVAVWSLDQRRAIVSFDVDAALTLNATVFHPDGVRLAIKEKRGSMTVRRVDDPQRRPRQIPTVVGNDPLGFTPGPDGYLVTAEPQGAKLQIWDLDSGLQVALLTAPLGSSYRMRRDEVGVVADGYARTLRLDPHLWVRSLCALASRPYTAEEATLVRERGARLRAPCP
jgi:hypothetical protein